MKSFLLIFVSFLCMQISYGQEICDNAIDDDGDGHIDLNDDECICGSIYGEITSLIPNPSFEEMDCCPHIHSEFNCIAEWVLASDGTTDYYNLCDFTGWPDGVMINADLTNIPEGEGWVGCYTNTTASEHGGICLDEPLLAGVEYLLNFHTAWGYGPATNKFCFYGTPNCTDLPWAGEACPLGIGSWELLISEIITFPTDGTWQEVVVTFTPTTDMHAIAFGGNCWSSAEAANYIYLDNLILAERDSISAISESGTWCGDNLVLEATIDTSGGTWQWYLEGEALIGETSHSIDAMLYGNGDYSVIYFLEGTCFQFDYTLLSHGDSTLNLEIISNRPTCIGLSDGSIIVNVDDLEGEFIIEIRNHDGDLVNEDNSNIANGLSPGLHFIQLSLEGGCLGFDTIFLIQVDPLAIDLRTSDIACPGDSTGWAIVDHVSGATGDYDSISYIWDPNPDGVGGLDADSSFNMPAGNYTVTVIDDIGCLTVVNFEIVEPYPLVFFEFGYFPALCRLFGSQNGNGIVFSDAAGGTEEHEYLWTNLDNGSTWDGNTWEGLNPGNYQLTVTDANGCLLTQSLVLDSINPIAAFSVLSPQLNADLQGVAPVEVEFVNTSTNFANPFDPMADTTFFWNLDIQASVWQISTSWYESFDTTYLSRGQNYTLDVCLAATNKNGCVDTACKRITVLEAPLFDPVNIFSPNEDGINDEFSFAFILPEISTFQCVIVNRWGIVVGELNNISESWNGMDPNGNRCSDGVYFYTYKATTDNNIKLEGQGSLQIIGGK